MQFLMDDSWVRGLLLHQRYWEAFFLLGGGAENHCRKSHYEV